MEEVKKILYKKITETYPKHDWYRNYDGEIDNMAYEYGYHNGPACKRCHYSFCVHCGDGSLDDGPCVVENEYYNCPNCNGDLHSMMLFINKNYLKEYKYCPYCGNPMSFII